MTRGAGNHAAPLTYEGAWDPDQTYLPRHVVTHGAGVFMATAKSLNVEPGATGSTGWLPLGGSTAIYLEGVIANGTAVVGTDVFPPGFRVPADSIMRAVTVDVSNAPVGSALVVVCKRRSTGSTLATVTVPAGSTTATTDGLAVALSEGDLLRWDITSIGSTTAAKNVLVSVAAT